MTVNLNEILEAHGKWLRGDGGFRADLKSADLRQRDLDAVKDNQ